MNPITEPSTPDNAYRLCVQEILAGNRPPDAIRMNAALRDLQAAYVRGKAGNVVFRYVADESTLQGTQVVAGATLIAMIDFTMAFAVMSCLPPGKSCVTISLTTQMQRAAQVGTYEVRATTGRVGGRVAFVRAELYDPESQELIADGTASFAVLVER